MAKRKANNSLKDLLDLTEWALDVTEQPHNECDLNSDDPHDCRAEEYGDGNVEDHQRIREGRAVLEKYRSVKR